MLGSPVLTICDTCNIISHYYSCIACNGIPSSEARKLDRIQQKFVSICRNHFIYLAYSYGNVLNYLILQTLGVQWCYLDLIFFK